MEFRSFHNRLITGIVIFRYKSKLFFRIAKQCLKVIGYTTQLLFFERATLTTDQRFFNL